MAVARKKKQDAEVVETEIVSVVPAEDEDQVLALSERTVAAKQRRKQIESAHRDLEEFLPKVQDTRQAMVEMLMEAFVKASEDETFRDEILRWILKHPRDAAGTLSTLNTIANTIVKPQQAKESEGKVRFRLLASKKGEIGVEVTSGK